MNDLNRSKRRRREVPRISDAEWAVMKVLWERGPATARQVVEALENRRVWKPKTIHTLLARLVQKGVLTSRKPEKEYVFNPAFTEEECRLAASRTFLSRVFDGSISPFLACLLKGEKLSPKEIEELKRIIEEREP